MHVSIRGSSNHWDLCVMARARGGTEHGISAAAAAWKQVLRPRTDRCAPLRCEDVGSCSSQRSRMWKGVRMMQKQCGRSVDELACTLPLTVAASCMGVRLARRTASCNPHMQLIEVMATCKTLEDAARNCTTGSENALMCTVAAIAAGSMCALTLPTSPEILHLRTMRSS